MDVYFCATQSLANSEAMYGTVAHVRSWLLLEYTSVWRRNAVEDSRLLSPAFKRYLRRLKRDGTVDRTLLIRREHRRTGPLHSFRVWSGEQSPTIYGQIFADYDQLPEARETPEPVQGLMYAVCTHGRHDKCCAKFGLPVFCAIRDLVGPRAWECSHVGGDRFAANLIVFPYGIYYGRVRPENIAEVVRRSEAGEVWLPGYRGRSCFPRAAQIAEYFARAETGRLAIGEFHPVRIDASPPLTTVDLLARTDGSLHRVEFSTHNGAFRQRLTCEDTESSGVPQHRLERYSRV